MNPRPLGYEPNELPDCSTPRQGQTRRPENTQFQPFNSSGIFTSNPKSKIRNPLVGLGRVELPTSRLSGVRSNQLSYRPLVSFASILTQKRATEATRPSSASTVCNGPQKRSVALFCVRMAPFGRQGVGRTQGPVAQLVRAHA